MATADIAIIFRSEAFSPNNVENDRLILKQSAEALAAATGCSLQYYSEDSIDFAQVSERVVVHMCRKASSLEQLARIEAQGGVVINSPAGINNCMRQAMTTLLEQNGVPGPQSIIVDTEPGMVKKALEEAAFGSCWLKRAQGHSMVKDDVAFAENPEQAEAIAATYRSRGITSAVINRHLVGDLVKFYGVAGSPFFHMLYPNEVGRSKHGQEAHNGPCHHYAFSLDRLKEVCGSAAEALGVVVYGGDCIIDAEGDMRIIDFNDWPSFSPCRDEAAKAIGARLAQIIQNK